MGLTSTPSTREGNRQDRSDIYLSDAKDVHLSTNAIDPWPKGKNGPTTDSKKNKGNWKIWRWIYKKRLLLCLAHPKLRNKQWLDQFGITPNSACMCMWILYVAEFPMQIERKIDHVV
jgi:hypothetical protein